MVENDIFERQRQRYEPHSSTADEHPPMVVGAAGPAPSGNNNSDGKPVTLLGKRGPQSREQAQKDGVREKKRKPPNASARGPVIPKSTQQLGDSGQAPPAWVRLLVRNGSPRKTRQRKERDDRGGAGKLIPLSDFEGCVATAAGTEMLFRLPQVSQWMKRSGVLQRKRGPNHLPRIDATRVLLCMGMMDLYTALEKHAVPDGAGGSRKVSEPFLFLPTEAEAPGYRRMISSPIALDTIRSKIQTGLYPTSTSFCQDINLMLRNARAYNEANSRVYNDAAELQRVFNREKAAIFPSAAQKLRNAERAESEARQRSIASAKEDARRHGKRFRVPSSRGAAAQPALPKPSPKAQRGESLSTAVSRPQPARS